MAAPELPTRTAVPLAVEHLQFDPRNPRYTPDQNMEGASDAEIIEQFRQRADLDELIESIASSGYIDIDPLIVTPSGNHYTVLEGNRRLAAIKLLSQPGLAEECGISLPQIEPDTPETLNEVTVYVVNDREDARDFIGFKHINGPHRWDSLAKARFAAEWYRRERDQGVTLRDIARRLGDRHDTIKRMVAGIYVLEQAGEKYIFDISDRYPGRPFAFSHLYTALTRPGYREFLGLPLEWRTVDPAPNPIPEDHLENLRQVLIWIYGAKEDDIRPVVTSQNPHIKQLAQILERPKARAVMMATNDLKAAYAEVETPALQFETALVGAHQNAESALGKVAGYDGKDETLLEIANELGQTSEVIVTTMKAKKNKISDDNQDGK